MEDYLVTTFCVSALITTGIYFFDDITNVAMNYLLHSPGVGRIYMKKNPKSRKKVVYACTEIQPFKLQYYKLPSIDTDISLFFDKNLVTENKKLSIDEFLKTYGEKSYYNLKKYDTGIITDIVRPRDFRGEHKICGFVCSQFEEYVYLFVVDTKFVDYEEIFENYENSLMDLPDDGGEEDSLTESSEDLVNVETR
jgi:hypothetical protein